ncbi:hypothetical protein [Branchiibius hedensis]|uniref:hypothetical protein n=1 Tax=Branchiibius hedensis TaxID=672460 RepID=UPI0014752F7C|nr:hypothetical protein [Branchiibius hedensis]
MNHVSAVAPDPAIVTDTADTPDAGTPATPVTVTFRVSPATNAPPEDRVSINRVEATGTYSPAATGVSASARGGATQSSPTNPTRTASTANDNHRNDPNHTRMPRTTLQPHPATTRQQLRQHTTWQTIERNLSIRRNFSPRRVAVRQAGNPSRNLKSENCANARKSMLLNDFRGHVITAGLNEHKA